MTAETDLRLAAATLVNLLRHHDADHYPPGWSDVRDSMAEVTHVLRRLDQQSLQPSAPTESGEAPDPLPEVLPPGTRLVRSCIQVASEATLINGEYQAPGFGFSPETVDWRHYRRASPQHRETEGEAPALLPSINHDGRPWWPWMLVLETAGKLDKIVANKPMSVVDLARIVAKLSAPDLGIVMRATSKATIDEATDIESQRVLGMSDEEVLAETEHPERTGRWSKATARWIRLVVEWKGKAESAESRAREAEQKASFAVARSETWAREFKDYSAWHEETLKELAATKKERDEARARVAEVVAFIDKETRGWRMLSHAEAVERLKALRIKAEKFVEPTPAASPVDGGGETGKVGGEKPIAQISQLKAGPNDTGWYYHDENYPDEGSVGPFATRDEAVAHAESGGYRVESPPRDSGGETTGGVGSAGSAKGNPAEAAPSGSDHEAPAQPPFPGGPSTPGLTPEEAKRCEAFHGPGGTVEGARRLFEIVTGGGNWDALIQQAHDRYTKAYRFAHAEGAKAAKAKGG